MMIHKIYTVFQKYSFGWNEVDQGTEINKVWKCDILIMIGQYIDIMISLDIYVRKYQIKMKFVEL